MSSTHLITSRKTASITRSLEFFVVAALSTLSYPEIRFGCYAALIYLLTQKVCLPRQMWRTVIQCRIEAESKLSRSFNWISKKKYKSRFVCLVMDHHARNRNFDCAPKIICLNKHCEHSTVTALTFKSLKGLRFDVRVIWSTDLSQNYFFLVVPFLPRRLLLLLLSIYCSIVRLNRYRQQKWSCSAASQHSAIQCWAARCWRGLSDFLWFD